MISASGVEAVGRLVRCDEKVYKIIVYQETNYRDRWNYRLAEYDQESRICKGDSKFLTSAELAKIEFIDP